MTSKRLERDERGVSDVVGVAVLISLSIVGALAVVAAGGMALNAITEQAQHDLADDSMHSVDSRLSALADSPVDATTTFTFPQGTGDKIRANASTGKVVIQATTVGQYRGMTDRSVCSASQRLGTIVHDREGEGKLVYQGGGLWKVSATGTQIESPPNFDYANNSIDFSFVSFDNLESISEGQKLTASLNASRAATTDVKDKLSDCWTLANASGTVPVEITVTIHSEYADGWARYANTSMTQPLGLDGNPATVVRRPSPNTVDISFGRVGNTSGAFTEPGDFPDGIIYAGLSQYAQYNEDVSPHDGGPEFTVDVDKHVTAFYYENESRWVYSKRGNSQWKYADGTPVQGSISQVHTSGNPTVYDFQQPTAICVINRTNMGAGQIQQKLESGDCTETMVGITSPSRISVGGSQQNGSQTTQGGLDYDENENVIEVESRKGTLDLLTSQIGEAKTLTNKTKIRRPMDVEFVLDRSGSMGWSYDGLLGPGTHTVPDDRIWEVDGTYYYAGETVEVDEWTRATFYWGSDPLGKRIDATKSFIDALNSSAGDTVGAVEFYTRTNILHEPSSDFEAVKDALVARSEGGTRIDLGLKEGIDELLAQERSEDEAKSDDKEVIVLLTDGKNHASRPKHVLDEMTRDQAWRAARQNITVHTVGLGEGADEALLKDIADITGGTYTYVDNADQLREKFEQIAQETKTSIKQVIQRDTTYIKAMSESELEFEVKDANNPTSTPSSITKRGLQNKSLKFEMTVYPCKEWERTNETESYNGKTYTEMTCKKRANNGKTIGFKKPIIITKNNQHKVADIDHWDEGWRKGPRASVQTIKPIKSDEAIIAMRVDDSKRAGYVLLHFDVQKTTKTVTDPGVDVSDMTSNVGDSSGEPVDVDIAEISVDG